MLIKSGSKGPLSPFFVKVFLVPRDAVTVPTDIKPIFCLTNVKTGTQATLCGVNTKVGTSKVLLQIKSLALSIVDVGSVANHTFVRAMMITKATTLAGTERSRSRIILLKGYPFIIGK